MRRYSLETKANISFVFGFFVLFIFCTLFYINNEKSQHIYLPALSQNSTFADIEGHFENLGFHKADNALKEIILKNNDTVQNSIFGNFTIIKYKGAYYIQFTDKDNIVLFLIKQDNFMNNIYLAFFLIVFILLTGFYIFTLKNVKSADRLKKTMKKIADSDINSETTDRCDKLNQTIQSITDIHNVRTLFLRSIMHELKTPIGKGRIIAEMVEDNLSKERLIKVFCRLETLIGELAKTEQLITRNYILEKKKHSLSKILNISFDFLMLEPEQLNKRVIRKLSKKSIYIDADLDSMALVFKNLMDNAIKYSSDGCVTVTLQKNTLSFSNKGKPLDKPIADYKKPFVSSDNKTEANMKMGLGLYIVENILTLHGLKLDYEYKDGFHCFFINLIAS
ncbi:MAG: ArsS family sensor histidine kinase [Campylobacteraceae bacterium]|jgi:two-component system OmpR family sensor kinase|nr:ArsS family sensor histidine kinase [Campylobacteraceae bacterium]